MKRLKPGDKVVIRQKGRRILNREFLECYDKFGYCEIVSKSTNSFYVSVPNVSDSPFFAGEKQITNIIPADCLLLCHIVDKSDNINNRINQFCNLFSK